MKQFILSKILGLLPVTLLKKPSSRVLFKEFDHKFRNTYFTERLSVAASASKIHKFLTSFMKLVLEIKLLLDFTVLKSSVGISYESAQNMFKVNNKDTRAT